MAVVGLVVVWTRLVSFLVAFGEDADEAGLAIEYAAYVGWCYSRVAPGGVHGEAELIFRRVPGAVVESVDACHCASCEFVQACAPGCVGRQSVGVHPCLGRLQWADWVH